MLEPLGQGGQGGQEVEALRNRGATHTVRLSEVQVLHATTTQAYVTGTLQPEGRVVVQGTHRLVQGQAVQIAAGEAD